MFSTSVNHPSWDKTEDYGIKIIMAKLRGSLPSIMLVYRTPLVDTSIHENIYCETLSLNTLHMLPKKNGTAVL